MGFANSTCSFTRFRILDPVSSELWQQIPDKLKQFAFRDIDDIPEMQAQGWVSFEDMLDSEWAAASERSLYRLFPAPGRAAHSGGRGEKASGPGPAPGKRAYARTEQDLYLP